MWAWLWWKLEIVGIFLSKEVKRRCSGMSLLYQKVSSDNQIKLVQELHPSPHVYAFSMFAIWRVQCLDISPWEIKRPPSHCSVLNMRSGILPASQSLPDDSQCWIGISLALGRDEREDWLLSKRDVGAGARGRGKCSPSIKLLRHWMLHLRHFRLLL